MKTYYSVFVILLFSQILNAQESFITGKIEASQNVIKHMRVVLYNASFIDTVSIDTTSIFRFKNLPNGVYSMKIEANSKETGYKDLLISDLDIEDTIINLPKLHLSKIKSCGDVLFLLGKKDTTEYYQTGEIRGEGQYKISKRYYAEYKSKEYSYKKHGLWNYFYKDGKLSRQAMYNNGSMISFTDYYENGKKKMIGNYESCKSKIWEYYSEEGALIFKVDFAGQSLIKISNEYLKNYMDSFEMIENNY